MTPSMTLSAASNSTSNTQTNDSTSNNNNLQRMMMSGASASSTTTTTTGRGSSSNTTTNYNHQHHPSSVDSMMASDLSSLSMSNSNKPQDSNNQNLQEIFGWIRDLSSSSNSDVHSSTSISNQNQHQNNKREVALAELSKKREVVPDLAVYLWFSFGSMSALLNEIVSVYPTINPPTTLSAATSNRVCNALALLQCVASHHETRGSFLAANIPLFLYPFLHTSPSSNSSTTTNSNQQQLNKTKPFEYLRLTSLGVIGALVKTDESQVINYLLTTEIIPLCLRIMESGSELSKTVSTFILQKILLDETGLAYICQTYDRFSHVAMILGKMVIALSKEGQESSRLLKHVIRCYLRLSDNPRAREALRQCLPDQLREAASVVGGVGTSQSSSPFAACLKDDKTTRNWLGQLLKNLNQQQPPTGSSGSSSLAIGQQQQMMMMGAEGPSSMVKPSSSVVGDSLNNLINASSSSTTTSSNNPSS